MAKKRVRLREGNVTADEVFNVLVLSENGFTAQEITDRLAKLDIEVNKHILKSRIRTLLIENRIENLDNSGKGPAIYRSVKQLIMHKHPNAISWGMEYLLDYAAPKKKGKTDGNDTGSKSKEKSGRSTEKLPDLLRVPDDCRDGEVWCA